MKTITIEGVSHKSTILVGESIDNVRKYMPKKNTVIITDENVSAYYKNRFPDCPVITIGTGESVKTLDTAATIYQALLDMDAQRSSFILGIGGGIVCDITGFIASTFLRGVSFGFVSTTLLSQVDASVGGKNGVNFKGYKNMVGVFNLPEFVICDTLMLETLPERERLCGFAEIIKHAAIRDRGLFDYLEENHEKALALHPEVIQKLVYDSVSIKADVVSRDEKEKGERRKLNFGHTFGHALEKTLGLPHGEAVSLGMVMAVELSARKGLLPPADVDRFTALLELYRLPTRVTFDRNSVKDALTKDKKREGDHIQFILLNGIGDCLIRDISLSELDSALDTLHPGNGKRV